MLNEKMEKSVEMPADPMVSIMMKGRRVGVLPVHLTFGSVVGA